MFRVLLAHLYEALYKQQVVYYVRVMSAGSTRIGGAANRLNTHAIYQMLFVLRFIKMSK
jgi:hypothetical protein